MASRQAGALYIDLRAKTARLQKGMTKATAHVNKFKRSASKSLQSVKRAVFSLQSAVIGFAGVGGLGMLVKQSFKTVDALAKTSDKLGTTTEALAGLHHAAELSGVSTRTFDMGLQRMTRRLSEAAHGTGEAQKAIKELGLDAKKLAALAPDEAFRVLSERMKDVSNQGDRVRLAMKFFDSEGVALVNTMAVNLGAAAEEAKLFGLAVSRVDAKKIENANDSFTRVKAVVAGVGNALAVKVAPWIEAVAKRFIGVAKDAGGMGNAVGEAVDYMVGKMAIFLKSIDYVRTGWLTIKTGVLSVAWAISKVGALFGSKLDAQLAKDFGIAMNEAIDDLSVSIANIGNNGEKLKITLQGITQEANNLAMTQVAALPEGSTEDSAKLDSVRSKEEEIRNVEQELRALRLADEIRYENERAKIAADAARERKETLMSTLGKAYTLISSHSKKLFKLGKSAAIASATINMYDAMQKARTKGFPLGAILMAVEAAVGMNNIQNIKKQSFGGGRAEGGRVSAGREYLVGENGVAEKFIPDSDGTIVPGGGSNFTFNMQMLDIDDAENKKEKLFEWIWNSYIEKRNEEGLPA